MAVDFHWEGIREFNAALVKIAEAADVAGEQIVTKGAHLVEAAAKQKASGRPGPNVVSGTLRRSIGLVDVTRLGPGRWQSQTAPTVVYARRIELGFHGADSLGRVYCVDMETEILTGSGWKTVIDLVVGELVLTLNPTSWLSEWQPLTAVHRFPGPHKLVLLQSTNFSSATTPDHRWLVERYYGRKRLWLREWRTTATLTAMCRVPRSAQCADLPTVATVHDDVTELAAWFWTEGHYNWSRQRCPDEGRRSTQRPISIGICQSEQANPKYCARIRELLGRLFGPAGGFADGAHWHERTNRVSGSTNFVVDRVGAWLLEQSVIPPHKALRPEWLRLLTQAQLDLLIDVSIMADGHIGKDGVTQLGQANIERIRSFEMACVLAGRPIGTHEKPTSHERAWVSTLYARPHASPVAQANDVRTPSATVRTTDSDDDVWCPETPNGTWLARRRGSIYFTGNSQPPFPYLGPGLDQARPALDALYEAEWAVALKV